jgi:two-component system chemotaxis response regulator CheY
MSTILVVDDTVVFREAVAATLRRRGHRTVCAGSGREALAAMERAVPDLILLDAAMPEMDGLTFLRAIRDRPAWDGLPVILTSAMTEESYLQAARDLGVRRHLLKSHFSLAEMSSAVDEHLRPAGGPPPGAEGLVRKAG